LDTIENIMRAVGVCVMDIEDRDKWRSKTWVTDPKYIGGRENIKRRRYAVMRYIHICLFRITFPGTNLSVK